MIKLSLNSAEAIRQQAAAPFANTLAAAVEAASIQPTQSVAQAAVKKQPKAAYTPLPSNGLLSRGIRWLQHKGRNKKRLHMIETVSLGEKRFVALVKVDGREFLLGGAPSSVGMLADLGAHGLGELLSAAVTAEPQIAEPSLQTASTSNLTTVAPAAKLEAEIEAPHAETIAPLVYAVPVSAVESTLANASALEVVTPRVNVVVEADDNESDWLLEDEMESMLKSATAMEPRSMRDEPVAAIAEITPAPVELIAAETPAAKLGPVAVPTPAPVAASNINFTFQMWPAPQASTNAVAVPIAPAPRVKNHIDLESCPELLSDPYVLSLVENARGAAA